jgi:hypothetical protein
VAQVAGSTIVLRRSNLENKSLFVHFLVLIS